ncbi:hypothetical protein Dda_1293 [Drechslerella dactyloides]|uniref:Uncharacterized protein n=1 Tax=Drechslerella dactyloides TaxID=74499 RepID=A0AAD6NKG7_DREDA|nr:hypothetical protein Dda_1293 [Drechslerella dactyloides]
MALTPIKISRSNRTHVDSSLTLKPRLNRYSHMATKGQFPPHLQGKIIESLDKTTNNWLTSSDGYQLWLLFQQPITKDTELDINPPLPDINNIEQYAGIRYCTLIFTAWFRSTTLAYFEEFGVPGHWQQLGRSARQQLTGALLSFLTEAGADLGTLMTTNTYSSLAKDDENNGAAEGNNTERDDAEGDDVEGDGAECDDGGTEGRINQDTMSQAARAVPFPADHINAPGDSPEKFENERLKLIKAFEGLADLPTAGLRCNECLLDPFIDP